MLIFCNKPLQGICVQSKNKQLSTRFCFNSDILLYNTCWALTRIGFFNDLFEEKKCTYSRPVFAHFWRLSSLAFSELNAQCSAAMGWGRHGGGGESDKWWQIVLQVGFRSRWWWWNPEMQNSDQDDDLCVMMKPFILKSNIEEVNKYEDDDEN